MKQSRQYLGGEICKLDSKICSDCGKEKPLSEFYTQNKHSKKRGNWLYYNPECKECTLKRTRKWRADNPKRFLKYNTEYTLKHRTSPEGKAYRRDQVRKWRMKGKQKEYQRNNPDKVKKYNKTRRHKNHNITSEEWTKCKDFFGNACAYCGMTENEHRERYNQDLHKEHVEHNGANDITNCVPSCKSCNSQKWEYELDDWYNESNPAYSISRYKKIVEWLLNINK